MLPLHGGATFMQMICMLYPLVRCYLLCRQPAGLAVLACQLEQLVCLENLSRVSQLIFGWTPARCVCLLVLLASANLRGTLTASRVYFNTLAALLVLH